jgi:hypothetical protein
MSKLLFILKRREDYNAILHNNIGLSTGLYNSAKFMNDMMVESGFDSNLEVAIDNNCIDRLITKHKPTHVIIEALWVVPSKITELSRLHPNVNWIIRLHSEMPFMAGEGMAMDWLCDYIKNTKLVIACNAPRMMREIKLLCGDKKVIYLPNYYPQEMKYKPFSKNKDVIDVACFGAIRPLKNHLVQVFAAIEFAEKIGKKLRFHINAGRIEMKGDAVKNNIRGLFEQISEKTGHQLINHTWTPREEFLKICAQMDIGLQCSFSETFNIVGADLISQGVPLVGSKEIPWSSSLFNARPTESKEICNRLVRTYKYPQVNVKLNQYQLNQYTNNTRKIWNKYFL